jgi:hypothetical protein
MENISEMSTEEFRENLNGKARIFPRQDIEEWYNEMGFNRIRQAFEDWHKELDARIQANDERLDKIEEMEERL